VGLAAAALGAARVVLTDLPHLVPRIAANAAANGLAGPALAVVALDWTAGAAAYAPGTPAAAAGVAPGAFDLIVASDVIYDLKTIAACLATIRALASPATRILLAFERREGTDAFDDLLRSPEAGFASVDLVSLFDLHPHWSSPDIWLYVLSVGG